MVFLLKILWFILPAGFANIFASISAKLFPRLNYPLDFEIKLNTKRVFGSHKTFRGLVLGLVASTIVFSLQKGLFVRYELVRDISVIDYDSYNLWLGTVMGFGALFGDSVKSFFKRRVGIRPGNPWFPFDQVDWVLGLLLFLPPSIHLDLPFYFWTITLSLILHSVIKMLGYFLKLEKKYI